MVEGRARDKQALLADIDRELEEQQVELEVVTGQVEYML